jgi:hypothetical protein
MTDIAADEGAAAQSGGELVADDLRLVWPSDRQVHDALEKHLAFLTRSGSEIFPYDGSGHHPPDTRFLDRFLASEVHPHFQQVMSRCATLDAQEFQRYIRFVRHTATRVLGVPADLWDGPQTDPWPRRLVVVAVLLLLHHYCAV